MADKNQLALWLLLKKDSLNPKLVQFDWPERYCNGLYDFECRLEWDGNKFYGRGLAENPDLAIEKSISEAIERLLCKQLGIPTVGVAVGGAISSEDHARNEALERFYLKKHLSNNIQPLPLAFGDIPIISQFKKQNQGAEIQLWSMKCAPSATGVIAALKYDGHHFYGFAHNVDRTKAITSSFFEAISNYAFCRDNPQDFSNLIKGNSDLWQLQPEFCARLSDLIMDGVEQLIPEPKLNTSPLDKNMVPLLADCPIYPVRTVVVAGEA